MRGYREKVRIYWTYREVGWNIRDPTVGSILGIMRVGGGIHVCVEDGL